MKIGCNYSDELYELLSNNTIDIDYFKVGAFGPFINILDQIVKIKPLLIHGFGFFEHAGMDMGNKVDWYNINKMLQKYKSPHLAFHFSLYDNDIKGTYNDEILINHMINTVKVWSKNINVPLLIENMDYCPYYENRQSSLELSVRPEVISRACQEAKVELLLDIAHAKVSAYHLNVDIYDYLEQLPLERVREIHITGTEEDKNIGLIDSHLELTKKDYDLLEYVLEKSDPDIITLEYGWPGKDYTYRTKKHSIKEQLIKLKNYLN